MVGGGRRIVPESPYFEQAINPDVGQKNNADLEGALESIGASLTGDTPPRIKVKPFCITTPPQILSLPK